MVETNSTSIRFPKEIAVLVVIAVFVTCPNHRFHSVTAEPNNEYGSGRSSNYQRNFRRGYQLEGDDLYSPYNPLWREEQVYTGERRGPIADPSYRRSRRSDGNSSPYSPLAPHIQDVDDVSSASSFSEFPLHSADIGRPGSWSNDLHGGHSERRKRRNWSFPIDFKRKKGRLNIGAPADNDRLLAAKTASKPLSDVRPSDGNAETKIETKPNRTVKTRDDQVTFSLDPFSLATLLGNGATAILGIGSVYVATLKLLGPMILAKHCLTNVNDRFNGRLLGKTSAERLQYTEQSSPDIQDNYGAARAATRTFVQILAMSCAGKAVGFVLDKTPCLLQPFWVCQWWYGVVWLASIYAIGALCEESVFVPFAQQTSNNAYSWLSIKSIPGTIPVTTIRKKNANDQNGRRNMARALFRFSRKMSQNPEEWIHSLFRSVPRWKNRNNYQRNRMTEGEDTESIEVDPLLFPSTWKPLSFVTFLALSKAILQSFCFDAVCTESKQFSIMRSFIVQKVLYSEWHRVFLQERRVALGAGVSVIGLFALMWSIYSVSAVDSIAALALVPTLMARMVNTWISILLAYNHIDISTETMTWKSLASRLTTTND